MSNHDSDTHRADNFISNIINIIKNKEFEEKDFYLLDALKESFHANAGEVFDKIESTGPYLAAALIGFDFLKIINSGIDYKFGLGELTISTSFFASRQTSKSRIQLFIQENENVLIFENVIKTINNCINISFDKIPMRWISPEVGFIEPTHSHGNESWEGEYRNKDLIANIHLDFYHDGSLQFFIIEAESR